MVLDLFVNILTLSACKQLWRREPAAVSLHRLVRTEAVIAAAQNRWLDLSNSESAEFAGLVIAALARDRALMQRTGEVLVAAALAAEFGITDIEGKVPKASTLEVA
jgi:dehydrogenase/reductase SDR family protein 1